MLQNQPHIINKKTLKIKVDDMGTAKTVNSITQNLLQQDIQAILDEVFDELPPGINAYINTLQIDLAFFSADDFKQNFTLALKQQLKTALASKLGISASAGKKTPGQRQQAQKGVTEKTIWDTLEFYLSKGVFPWWFSGTDIKILIQNLETEWPHKEANIAKTAVFKLLKIPVKFQRFIELIPGYELEKWAKLFSKENGEILFKTARLLVEKEITTQPHTAFGLVFYPAFTLNTEHSTIQKENILTAIRLWLAKTLHTGKNAVISRLIELFSGKKSFIIPPGVSLAQSIAAIFEQTVMQITSAKSSTTTSRKTRQKSDTKMEIPTLGKKPKNKGEESDELPEQAKEPIPAEGVMVANAGLVLSWPFLPKLFEKADFVEDGNFKDTSSQKQAALLLHYLVYQEMPEDEGHLFLNKILCGLHPSEAVSIRAAKGDNWDELRTELWTAVLHSWDKMKNTSIVGFVETFIKREGIVRGNATGWQVIVDRKTLDVLLQTLPWPISIIKPKWNTYLITVTW